MNPFRGVNSRAKVAPDKISDQNTPGNIKNFCDFDQKSYMTVLTFLALKKIFCPYMGGGRLGLKFCQQALEHVRKPQKKVEIKTPPEKKYFELDALFFSRSKIFGVENVGSG